MIRTPFIHLCLLLIITPFYAFAQVRCGLVEYEKTKYSKSEYEKRIHQFEQWVIQKKAITQDADPPASSSEPYLIPVVVHVIHNGEREGTGLNISTAQIHSQIKVINADFQRKNADAKNTLDEFLSVAGEFNIQFQLAKQNPQGLPSNGIIRIDGKRSSWSIENIEDETRLKKLSFWPPESYLNIWVSDYNGVLGYSSFPDYDLPGINDIDDDYKQRLIDGIMIGTRAFGSIADDPTFDLFSKYNLGRTLTHEIGHYFGLRHIWGDTERCLGSDYVDDTPQQSHDYSNQCPSTQQRSCQSSDMYQNYLDYTNDACMNLFSKGQIARMTVVLKNAPRRRDLLTSKGALSPTPPFPPFDISLIDVSPLSVVTCQKTTSIEITISNLGSQSISEFILVTLGNNNTRDEQKIYITPLQHQNTKKVIVEDIPLVSGNNNLTLEVLPPIQQITDINPGNNKLTTKIIVNDDTDRIPLRQSFETNLTHWTITGEQSSSWQLTSSYLGQSLYAPLHDKRKYNQASWLVSPVLDFTNTQKASLFFDVGYGFRPGTQDSLILLVSDNCGASYQVLFNKTGEELSNTEAGSQWNPLSSNAWKREFIRLTPYAGKQKMRFAFVAMGQSSSFYLDNIEYYIDDKPNPVKPEDWVSVYSTNPLLITFNLPTPETVTVLFYSGTGQLIANETLHHVLNQTYPIQMEELRSGIYIVRIISHTNSKAIRLFLSY